MFLFVPEFMLTMALRTPRFSLSLSLSLSLAYISSPLWLVAVRLFTFFFFALRNYVYNLENDQPLSVDQVFPLVIWSVVHADVPNLAISLAHFDRFSKNAEVNKKKKKKLVRMGEPMFGLI